MRHDREPGRTEARHAPLVHEARDRGVVFDFTGKEMPGIRDLTLLVTACMLAEQDARPVWVRALPHRSWEVLQALGLAHLFRLFPSGGGPGN